MNFAKKMVRVKAVLRLPGVLFVAGSVFAGCTKSLPQDEAGGKVTRFENLRGLRYTEVLLIGGNPITKDLKGATVGHYEK